MVIELSYVCFWQLQVYPVTNARTFLLLFGCYELFILMSLLWSCQNCKKWLFRQIQNLGFSLLLALFHALSCTNLT